MIQNILNNMRQWCYPPEFRISQPSGATMEEDIKAVLRSLSDATKVLTGDGPASGDQPLRMQALDEGFISDLATRLWRLRRCLQRPDSPEPAEGVERGYRHLDRLFDRLEHLGIRIVERTGTFYDPGMAIKVVSSEPMDGIGRKIIKETVSPAVYRDDDLIQIAQVVVGVPVMAMPESCGPDRITPVSEPGRDQSQNTNPIEEPDETAARSE